MFLYCPLAQSVRASVLHTEGRWFESGRDNLNISRMTLVEIKKALYREKPEARLSYIRGGSAYYYADLEALRVRFEVPVSDMGDADFGPNMDAKYLIRWITIDEE